jgi:hypothetical protein
MNSCAADRPRPVQPDREDWVSTTEAEAKVEGAYGEQSAHRPSRSTHPTDRPFLETKEAPGGYYVLEASDLERLLRSPPACLRFPADTAAWW